MIVEVFCCWLWVVVTMFLSCGHGGFSDWVVVQSREREVLGLKKFNDLFIYLYYFNVL